MAEITLGGGNSGGFFGGLSSGISSAQAQALADRKQQQTEMVDARDTAIRQIDATIQHISSVAKAAAAQGNDPQKILAAAQPLIQSAQGLAQAAGIDPNMITQRAVVAASMPPAEDNTKHSLVKVGSGGLEPDIVLQHEATTGKITRIDPKTGQPILSQSDVITPDQANRVNPPVASAPPVQPSSAPASPDGTPAQTVAARFPDQGTTPAQDTPQPTGPKLPPDIKPGADAIGYAVNNNITGDEFLKAVPPDVRGLVKDIAEYRVDPKTLSVKGGRREQILGLASQYSGHTYDQKFYSSMSKAINEFTSGGPSSPAGQITAGNVAIQHLGTVAHGIDKLEAVPGLLDKIAKSDTSMVSYAANALKNTAIRGTSEGQALQAFLTARNRYAEEITKFYAGSQGGEADRKRSIDTLDAALSPGELYSSLNTESELLNGKINALQSRWQTAMAGPRLYDATIRKAVPNFPILQAKSEEALDQISKGYFARKFKGNQSGGAAGGPVDFRTYFGGQQ